MKKMTIKTKEKIFNETFENLSKAMLGVLEKFSDHSQRQVFDEALLALIMFATHSSVKMGISELEMHEMINEMTTAVHAKMKAEGIFYDA